MVFQFSKISLNKSKKNLNYKKRLMQLKQNFNYYNTNMFYNIPAFICDISFRYHQEKVNQTILLGFIILQGFQYLSFLLPSNGWGIWKYTNTLYYCFQQFTQYCKFIAFLQRDQFENILYIITIIIIIGIVFFFCVGILYFNFLASKSNKFFFKLSEIFIYWFIFFSQNLLQLPFLKLFIVQIGCQVNINNDNCNSILNQQNILNIICLILLALFNIIWHYFFKCFTFFPSNLFYQKFSFTTYCCGIFNLILSLIDNFQTQDSTLKYIQLTIFHLTMILQMKEYIMQQTTKILINQIGFTIYFCLELLCIILTIIIFQESSIKEDNLPFLLLLFFSIGWCLGMKFYEVITSTIIGGENLNQPQGCIIFVEVLFQYYQIIKDYKKQSHYFKLHKKIKNNRKYLPNLCDNYDVKKLKSELFKLLHSRLDYFSQTKQVRFESLALFVVGYLNSIFGKPLLGLVELKKYEIIIENEQSYFLKKMKLNILAYLKSEIQEQQKNIKQQLILGLDRQIHQSEVQETAIFQQEIIPLLNQLLDFKIQLMNQQIQGFQHIYTFYQLALIQGEKMKQLEQKISGQLYIDLEKLDHNSFSLNVLQLKILSIFFSMIMNDYHSTLICEKTIEEILNIDHTISNDIVNNIKLINNKVVLIQLSMIKERGAILNKNKDQIALYFGYEIKVIEQMKNIKELMPFFFAISHDQLLQQYLQTAKSIFVEKFNQIFSKDTEGFLVSQQLKIDNDFTIQDDYVLIGCINELKFSYDYILFSDDGKIIGMTKTIYETIVQDQQKLYSIQYLIDGSYIFMYFRQIIDIINEYKKSLKSNYSQQQETTITLTCSTKLSQIIEKFAKQYLPLIRTGNNNDRLNSQRTQTIQRNKSVIESSNMNDNNENQNGTTQNDNQDQVQLFDQIYQDTIADFLQNYNKFELLEFYVRASINRRSITISGKQKGYFVMELSDIRKKLQATTSAESSVQFPQLNTSSFVRSSILESQLPIDGSFNLPQIQEQTPNITSMNYNLNSLLSKFSPRNPTQHASEDHSLAFNSARESFNIAPVSQRVNFISPSFVQQQQELCEKDLNDMLQLEQEINNYSKQIEVFQEIDQDEEVKENIENPHDSSKKKSKSILKIFNLNKTYKEQHIQPEWDAQKSKSSQTSRTSGVSAIQIIKKFQKQQHMSFDLKVILILNLFLAGVLIAYIIIMSQVITSQENYIMKKVDDLRSPMLILRYYLKLFQLSWTLLITAVGITNSSDYLITQSVLELTNVRKLIYTDLDQYYDNFIALENEGAIGVIQIQLRYKQIFEANFLEFYDYLQNLAESMFVDLDVTPSTLLSILTDTFFNNILLLRFNIEPLVSLGQNLINAISEQFYTLLQQKEQSAQIMIIVEILVFGAILYLQIYFWKEVHEYIQSIILIAGKLSETQQRQQILKILIVKDSLSKQIGKQSWMKTDFYQTAYLQIDNQENSINNQNIQKQYLQLRSVLSQNQNNSRSFRQNVNMVLNYRIQSTKIKIWKEMILVSTTMLIITAYISGTYGLYKNQMTQLMPTQELTIKYINFLADMDVLISYSYIIKTQPLMLQYFSNSSQNEYYSELDSRINVVDEFNTIISYFGNELDEIYAAVQSSNQISGQDLQQLDLLYQSDFCEVVHDEIPFCSYSNLSYEQFCSQYGTPESIDDNRGYLSQGLVGIVSTLNALYKQSYDYETTYDEFSSDLLSLEAILNTQQFNNAIAEHFIDTSVGTTEFFNIILQNEQSLLDQDLSDILIYIYTLGGFLVALYILSFIIWIAKIHKELKYLRLVLTNLPIDILTEQHTLSQIKRLS